MNMSSGIQGFIVDAFTGTAFSGNPAAVVLLENHAPDEWMQHVAAEFNLSETAFVSPANDGGVRTLRWFTPTVEVDLCGHATLAAGHVLGGAQIFMTRSGELRTVQEDDWVEMDFPSDNFTPVSIEDDTLSLIQALGGVTPVRAARGTADLLVELSSGKQVRNLVPDMNLLRSLPVRGIIVTAPGDREGIDFVSRCFYPAVGVPEDPVTGSAHCTLACWWSMRLGHSKLVGEQASSRGGVVRVEAKSDRVILRGQAVTVARTEILV